jgi:hypothetical protein
VITVLFLPFGAQYRFSLRLFRLKEPLLFICFPYKRGKPKGLAPLKSGMLDSKKYHGE